MYSFSQAVYLSIFYKPLIVGHNKNKVPNVPFGAINAEIPLALMQPVK